MNYPQKLLIGLVAAGLVTDCANDNEEDLYPETAVCNTSAVTYAGTV